ncbi:MAG TPA: polysaccharide deacetylase family protein [Bacteroidales bacterium]|nr:polysaccharide deacetylase family protein [Bacteroidales bacterium]
MKYFLFVFFILISCSKDEYYSLAKEVIITIDDAPNFPENTSKILDVLKKHKVKATFFCIGHFLEIYPDIASRIATEQFMGNHTYTHINIENSNLNDVFKQEILQTQHIIDSLQPLNKHYFRPPYGKLTTSQMLTLTSKGFEVVMWDLSAEEWDNNVSTQNVVDYFHENLYLKFKTQIPIILFHLNNSTVEALDILLTEFEKRNIRVITLDDFKGR